MKAFTAWGGIPRYWELAAPFAAWADEAVDSCVLDPLSPLRSEPDRPLLDEVPPALALRPILNAVGLGAHRPPVSGSLHPPEKWGKLQPCAHSGQRRGKMPGQDAVKIVSRSSP